MIKLDRERIKKDASKLNDLFPKQNLKGRKEKNNRVHVAVGRYDLSDVKYLNKNFECIIPIFYSKGEHAYRLYAPLDFIKYLELNYRNHEKELNSFFSSDTFFEWTYFKEYHRRQAPQGAL